MLEADYAPLLPSVFFPLVVLFPAEELE